MTKKKQYCRYFCGHRISIFLILCLFGIGLVQSKQPQRKRRKAPKDERVHLIHADKLYYDMYGSNPEAQVLKGKVAFSHAGATLHCDSAYFFQNSNSFQAFGHVRLKQGDTLTLNSDFAEYDGSSQMMYARRNVVLKHRRQTLYTDSLDYDRLYNNAYFFEGGTLVDGKDRLVSDWGEYNTELRQAVFYYNVKLRSANRLITGDTLYYDTKTSMAHMTGPTQITSGENVINTEDGWFDTRSDNAQLFGRSTIIDKNKTITGDSLYHNAKTGVNRGIGNVVYVDSENKNEMTGDYLEYNQLTGYGYATGRAMVKDYSQQDTLYMHADTMKLYTYNIDTDSVYRVMHGYPHVRAYRVDMQAVCDSMVVSSIDSCLTMYKDPIVWSDQRQLLGEVIEVYMNDSTVRLAKIINQAFSIEMLPDTVHYNQISSKLMNAYFIDGAVRMNEAIGNVRTIYFPVDDKDKALIGLNYMEADTMRMFISPERKLERIKVPSKANGVLYPMSQIPQEKLRLPNFAWFDYIRPVDKDDIFEWRGKKSGQELKVVKRHEAPLQKLSEQPSMPDSPQRPDSAQPQE